jgi:plastocyanin
VFRLAAPHPARRLSVGLAAFALTVSALAGCGGDDGGSAAETSATTAASASETPAPTTGTSAEAPAETQSITATEADFSISLDQDTLPAGTYDIEVVNDGNATHDLVVERDGADVASSDTIAPGQSTTVSVALEPGEYVFYCSIGNHRAMGMELTVTVT